MSLDDYWYTFLLDLFQGVKHRFLRKAPYLFMYLFNKLTLFY